jgi:ribosomal protein S18 acetylase RimI-like enzyme
MHEVIYAGTAEGVEAKELRDFFVDWPRAPTPEQRLALLQGSDHVVVAREGDRIVGFVTAISDGVLSAFIPLLEVIPECQGRGIGSELMRRMLAVLGDLYMVDLCCDAGLEPFYARLGLRVWDRGMGLRRPEALVHP